MSKYTPLRDFLQKQRREEVRLTFAEIERLIGGSLPPSARKHRAWWSNNPSNSVITEAWLNAGFRTEQVDMAQGRLVFHRDHDETPAPASSPASKAGEPGLRHPLFGMLKGLMRIAPGTDLTQPADPDWGRER
jgi:hypothetical protein